MKIGIPNTQSITVNHAFFWEKGEVSRESVTRLFINDYKSMLFIFTDKAAMNSLAYISYWPQASSRRSLQLFASSLRLN